MLLFQLLATIFVASIVVIVFFVARSLRAPRSPMGLDDYDFSKLKVTCTVPCNGGTLSRTCVGSSGDLCAQEMLDECRKG